MNNFGMLNMPKKLEGQQLRDYEEATRRAEIEHAPGVAVRMNPRTFRVEYYDTRTGNIVSSHI